MQTVFRKLDLDLIRYSLVWEDENSLVKGLDINSSDEVLLITSAGCNVLNVLLQNPKSVTAIDLNIEQNRLLTFKIFLIENYDYATFAAIMGFYGRAAVKVAWEKVSLAMNEHLRAHAQEYFLKNPDGLMSSGKLENYIHSFMPQLPLTSQRALEKLVNFGSLEAQRLFFKEQLESTDFKELFIDHFDEHNLSKGRDSSLFKYATSSGGTIFYERLKKMVESTLIKNNFYARFFFFGVAGMPACLLPACYQESNFKIVRQQLSKLKIVEGEAVDYLLAAHGRHITKAGLSNIFEYVSPAKFDKVCYKTLVERKTPLRFMFWNLLQSQAEDSQEKYVLSSLSKDLTESDSCFYFNNVKVLEN